MPQHEPKGASSWAHEQKPTQNITQDTPALGRAGPTIATRAQHKICIKPTAAAVAINTTADQKGAK